MGVAPVAARSEKGPSTWEDPHIAGWHAACCDRCRMWFWVKRYAGIPFAATVVALAAVLWSPLLDVYWFASHEGDAYVIRTAQFLAAVEEGIVYPRWADDMYGGFGAPFFVFYPPLVYGASAVFAGLTGSVVVGLKTTALLATLAAGVGMYLLVRLETRRRDAALVAAGMYLAAPYRITNFSVRGDLAEYMAIALVPLAIYCYRRCTSALELHQAARYAALAALTHAAVILSHTLLGLWSTKLIAIVVGASALQAWSRRSGRHVALLFTAFGFSLLLSAAYTLPALAEKGLVRVEAMADGPYRPADRWLFWEELTQFGQFFFLPALGAALLLALAAALMRRQGALPALACTSVALLVCYLVLPHASSFWADPFIPGAAMIQFPWRLLGLGWIALSVAAGFTWSAWLARPRAVYGVLAAAAATTMCLIAFPLAKLSPLARSHVADSTEAIRGSIVSTTGVNEYLPKAVNRQPRRARKGLLVREKGVAVHSEVSSPSRHAMALTLTEARTVRANLHHFPGWTVAKVSGPGDVVYVPAADGQAALQFSAAGDYEVVLTFARSSVRRFAESLTVLALLALWPSLWAIAGSFRGRNARLPHPRAAVSALRPEAST